MIFKRAASLKTYSASARRPSFGPRFKRILNRASRALLAEVITTILRSNFYKFIRLGRCGTFGNFAANVPNQKGAGGLF